MRLSMSLHVARLLLVAVGALVAGTALFIGAASSDRATAAPWLLLLVLDQQAKRPLHLQRCWTSRLPDA